MTLSHRNSSRITVGDIEYRWAIAARSQAETDRVTLVIQPPDHGQRVVIDIPCRDRYLKIQEPEPAFNYVAVTPRLVRKLIDVALELDWSPKEKGKQLSYAIQEDESLVET